MAVANSAIFSNSLISGCRGHLIVSATRDSSSARENEFKTGVSKDEGIMLLAFSLCVSGLVPGGLGDWRLIPILSIRSIVKRESFLPRIYPDKYLFVRRGDPAHGPRCHNNNHEADAPVSTRKTTSFGMAAGAPFPLRCPACFRLRLGRGHFAYATFPLGGLWLR